MSANRLDLREIEIDGHRWAIVLECWTASRRWCGRLIFVAPTGRAWPDAGHFFRGDSPLEVVGQALSLSDLHMAGRLRNSVPI